jgi:hypothetical protein
LGNRVGFLDDGERLIFTPTGKFSLLICTAGFALIPALCGRAVEAMPMDSLN